VDGFVRRPFTIILKPPRSKQLTEFNTVARSEAEALRLARRFHPRARHVETRAGA
jgi:hypothetical protein